MTLFLQKQPCLPSQKITRLHEYICQCLVGDTLPWDLNATTRSIQTNVSRDDCCGIPLPSIVEIIFKRRQQLAQQMHPNITCKYRSIIDVFPLATAVENMLATRAILLPSPHQESLTDNVQLSSKVVKCHQKFTSMWTTQYNITEQPEMLSASKMRTNRAVFFCPSC